MNTQPSTAQAGGSPVNATISTSTNCPSCGDANTQPCHAAFAAGTTSVSTTTTGGGLALGVGGRLAPMVGTASTKGVQMTNLAALCAPPAKPKIKPSQVGGLLIGFGGLGVIGSGLGFIYWLAQVNDRGMKDDIVMEGATIAVIGVVSLIVTAVSMSGPMKVANAEHEQLLAAWRKRWVCHRCNHQWDTMTTPITPDVAGNVTGNNVTPPSKARRIALGCGISFIGVVVVLALLLMVFGKHRQSDDGTVPGSPSGWR